MNESTISNGIQTRQNEEGNVAKLAAADRLYSEVKRMSFFKFLIAVIFPFALSWIQLFWDNSLITSVSCVLAVISMLLSYRLTPAIQRKVTLAADIKQDYDVSVYQMPWNPALFGTRKNLAREIAENNAAGRNRNENNKFRDWYRPETDSLSLEEGIFACQKENYAWDANIRKRYRNLCAAGIGTLILVIFGIGILRDESVTVLLARLLFIIPILSWLLETVKDLNEDMERLEEMKAEFQSADTRNMEDLQKIQKNIYEHRKSSLTPPGFVYQLFRDRDEETARRTIEMESWGKRD